uniref:Uncharacterized protein n=1 Tax=Arundo donax TaxID=35708 RepID=A0A0A9DVF6_ARUDO
MLESMFLARRCACNLMSNQISASQGAQGKTGPEYKRLFYLAYLTTLLSPVLYGFLEWNTPILG